MKFGYRSTNVFSVVASDGSLADWEITLPSMQPFPTFIFAAPEPGESPAYSDTVTGADEIWIKPGEPLKTTVTATHPVYTGIKQTAELVVANIELEPITCETTAFGHTLNPSGVPTDGTCGFFKIKVEPHDPLPGGDVWVQDSEIEWVPDDSTAVHFFGDNATGREVAMGLYNGTVQTVSVEISDYVHPAPTISFAGHTRRTIPVRFMVTCDRYGNNPAATAAQCTNWVTGANQIFDQIGVMLSLQSVAFTNRNEWHQLDITDETEKAALRASLPTGNGFEVYVIDHFENSMDIQGQNTLDGSIITKNVTDSVVAHELGHQLGLRDIYADASPRATNSVPDNLVSRAWMPSDWTGSAEPSYYVRELRHHATLRRLLMYGAVAPGQQRDIPLGDVHGVWYEHQLAQSNQWTRVYHTSPAPVGRFHIKQSGYDHQ